jgi:hypothetical protein
MVMISGCSQERKGGEKKRKQKKEKRKEIKRGCQI